MSVPNDGVILTPLERSIAFVENMRKFDDFMARAAKKLGIFLERNMEVKGFCKEKKEAKKLQNPFQKETEMRKALEELGFPIEDRHPAEKSQKPTAKRTNATVTEQARKEGETETSRRANCCMNADISKKEMANTFGHQLTPAAIATPVKPHPKGSQQAQAAGRRAEKAVQRTEAAMTGTVKPQKEKYVFQLFKRPQQKTKDYTAMARARASKLPQVQTIPNAFFHQKNQYTFDAFTKALEAHNVAFFKHPTENKVKVCFKGQGDKTYVDNGWVDIPHGTQLEKGHHAGWVIRIKELLQKHGAVAEKQKTVEKTTKQATSPA